MTAVDVLHAHTLGDVLREHARSWPRRTAVVDGDVRLTYRALDERVNRLARALSGLRVGGGDRVLWLGQGSFRVLELLLAAAKLGAMCCPANWRSSVDETAFVLDDLDPAVVVWQDEEIGGTVRAARERAGHRARWLRHDAPAGPDTYEGAVAEGAAEDPDLPVDPASSVLVMYTAAFTGRPAGALLGHAALIGQSLVLQRVAEVGPDHVYLNSGPLFHMATLMTTVATFVAAGTNVFTRRADAAELCRLIEAERCTGAFLVGPTVNRILEVNADGRYDLTSLRAFPGKPAWNEMITVDTSPWARNPGGYGQTEVTGMLTFNSLAAATVGAHGRPSPLVQVRVVDPDGDDVPDGEVGEMVVRGPLVANGYWNRPDETAHRQVGGWHHTSDLARREADGTLTFIGPKTRIIKSALENVYPTEVEACIARHPAVAECAVIGVPDPEWTQRVVAVVALRDGVSASAEDIVEHCRAAIASYKKPRQVEFVDRLPRRGFAVDYDALDARFGGGGYPGEQRARRGSR
ncbi:MAG: AMP-binding protein [Acidimicrobiia bacterium]|nr:AMP-binding protein [Acidimicrobiia bacterium]